MMAAAALSWESSRFPRVTPVQGVWQKALRIILLHEHLASVTDVIGVDQAFGVVKCRIASLWQRAPGSLLIKNQR